MAKGDKFTADHPVPAKGKRTFRDGTPFPDDFFENESDEATVLKSEAIAEKQLAKEDRGDRQASRRRRQRLRRSRLLAEDRHTGGPDGAAGARLGAGTALCPRAHGRAVRPPGRRHMATRKRSADSAGLSLSAIN